jgi:hypothetical protein
MSTTDQEEVVAPTLREALAAAVAPVSTPDAECTRDTRGDALCAAKDCENCN